MHTNPPSITFCSIGENCLPQGILDRHKVPSCIGPFSWARSNIDYILELLKEDFADFLEPRYLQHRQRYSQEIATNSKYRCDTTKFDKSVASEFEFTHHDVVKNQEARENLVRKTARFRELIRSDVPVVFIYHHRGDLKDESSLGYVIERLQWFIERVSQSHSGAVSAICFTQKIVKESENRRLELTEYDQCQLAVFHTTKIWGGSDPDVFWGNVDDDLFSELLKPFLPPTSGEQIRSFAPTDHSLPRSQKGSS